VAANLVGFNCRGDSLLAVGSDDNPSGDLIFAFDKRAGKEAQQMKDEYGEENLKIGAGYPVQPEFVPAQIFEP
jgi:sugar (pentulose or hexulose) kinase